MKISIITPSLNTGRYMEAAILSVLRQDWPDVEHLIMDGGSTDDTLEIVSGFASVAVISEPDDGPHDAMNKGLGMATGDIVGFLNPDDFYADDVFAEVARLFATDPATEMVTGAAAFITTGENPSDEPLYVRMRPDEPDLLTELTLGVPCFNAWFFRRTLLDRLRGCDCRYSFAADRDLLIRACLESPPRMTDQVFYYYRIHPASRTLMADPETKRRIGAEHLAIARSALRGGGLSAQTKRDVGAWYSYERAVLALRAAARLELGETIRHLREGLRHRLDLPFQAISARIRQRQLAKYLRPTDSTS